MSFTDIFIRRPVLATVVSLMILLVGLASLFNLSVRQYPEITNTTLTITTAYPGANAELIRGFITTPIMSAVASAEGIDTLTSSSQQNVSTITLNLRLDANADRAVSDVLSKVQQVKNILPREAQDPIVTRQTGDTTALMYMSFNSKVMTPSQITDYLTRVVQPRLQTIDGVANAQILGGQTFAMRIWLNPDKMAALAITPLDVRTALTANNFVTAAGQVKGDFVQTSINAQTLLDNPTAFGKLVVATRGDALVRLDDIAAIELGPESADSSSVFDGQKAVFIGVFATPTSNPLVVIDKVRKAFPDIQRQLPEGMEAAIAYDATKFIEASIKEVQTTLIEAGLIVIVVIFLFLGNLRSTIIPVVTIPLSLIGVMFVLLALGYSINLLTLLWTDGDRHLPCDYRLYDKPTDHKSKNDHFQDLLRVAKERGMQPECVLFDGWYSSLENLKLLKELQWRWLTRLKANRRVNPDRTGLRALSTVDIAATGTVVHLERYGLIKVFRIEAKDGTTEYWATNDLEMDDLQRLRFAEASWKIEEYHRGLKQVTNVERCQCRAEVAQRNHLGLALRAFVVIEQWCFRTGINWLQAKWSIVRDAVRAYRTNPSFRHTIVYSA